jgi:Na+-translocating ferredoxin:NAD+ oxidoreductase RnfD subunit
MYLAGGLLLLSIRLITWHIPLAFLLGLAATAGMLHLIDPSQHASPLLHLFSGGAMLGAFFIATDPVTGRLDAARQADLRRHGRLFDTRSFAASAVSRMASPSPCC